MTSKHKQDPPFCVLVELTEGCTLACKFCGINGIREKQGGFKNMSMDTARQLGRLLVEAKTNFGWNPRIEFSMHGEPSDNPDQTAIIALLRESLPESSMLMLSNGSGFVSGDTTKKIDELFDAGLNTLAIEQYSHSKFWTPIMVKYAGTAPITTYPDNKEANPHARQPPGSRRLVFVADIFHETKGNHAHINTHCGAGSPPEDTHHGKPCAKPFREFSIRWDGNVALCCNDWRGYYKCGNIHDSASLDRLWNGAEFDAARRELYLGNRQNVKGVCSGCNETSYRSGLLPDKYGKKEMPKPNLLTKQIIKESLSGEPYTKPVKREWE